MKIFVSFPTQFLSKQLKTARLIKNFLPNCSRASPLPLNLVKKKHIAFWKFSVHTSSCCQFFWPIFMFLSLKYLMDTSAR